MKKYLSKLTIYLLLGFLLGVSACTARNYEDPPNDLSASDLVGTWEARDGKDITDTITIREDVKYQQFYENRYSNYRFTTNWDLLRIEYLSNRSIYIHLEHGRYFSAGEEIAGIGRNGSTLPKRIAQLIFSDTQSLDIYPQFEHVSIGR